MSVVAKKGVERELVPSGSHVARCIKIMHFGHVPNVNFHGQNVITDIVRLIWELPNEMRTFNEEKGPQPMAIHREYTLSLADKANLYKDLVGWRGKGFTQVELDGFDIFNVLGVPCMLSVIHQPNKAGNDYAKVVAVSGLPKGTECPENINPLFVWDYNQNYDEGVLENLHEWFRDKIKSSEEYKAKQMVGEEITGSEPNTQESPMPGLGDAPPDDGGEYINDLPF
ncbi:hypothetical protein LCGC14_1990110 [marine sediment metagenome]|uniref:Uncharacterized protein n=1 Tax=marine sediment metagenome TaxID=412755 RepID=A0A0F9HJN8_9ZZZZ